MSFHNWKLQLLMHNDYVKGIKLKYYNAPYDLLGK